MNIVIIGAGVVGQSLAEQLSIEGHQVSVVDRDRSKLRSIGDKLDVLCVHGHGGQPSVLERAGVKKAQMVIAVTTSASASAAALGNIGPGLSAVGPAENWAHLPAFAKWVMSLLMLLGRLELFSVVVLFTPWAWRR
jgi:ketopantoate reductase